MTWKCNDLRQEISVISRNFWESGVWEQLSGLGLALGLPWGCTQGGGQGWGLLKAWQGKRVSFQVPAYGYQLEGLSSLPRGPLQLAARGAAAGFPQSAQSERE